MYLRKLRGDQQKDEATKDMSIYYEGQRGCLQLSDTAKVRTSQILSISEPIGVYSAEFAWKRLRPR